jgi:hypothetical protein
MMIVLLKKMQKRCRNKAEAKKLMKTGKMAPQPEKDAPKIKMRCGKKNGGLVKQGKPKLAKKGWR